MIRHRHLQCRHAGWLMVGVIASLRLDMPTQLSAQCRFVNEEVQAIDQGSTSIPIAFNSSRSASVIS